MKHVGLNVAADPLFTASYTGVNGGLVICVADDPGMHSSQNEQDSRHYAFGSKTLMLEPSDSADCRDFMLKGYELSEKYDTPVLIRLSTRVSHSRTLVDIGERDFVPLKEYKKDMFKYVMMPNTARFRHVVVEKRIADLNEYAETTELNRLEYHDKKIGVITSGIAYQYAREALGNEASFLKLGMVYPLPAKLIKDFVASVDVCYVVEELDPIIENHCRVLGLDVLGKEKFSISGRNALIGEYDANMIREVILGEKTEAFTVNETLPPRPPVMCSGCSHRGVFYVLKQMKLVVTGDIGCYTLGALPPQNAMDTCLCMGASIGMAHGMEKALGRSESKKTVAVIGDSTFIHSGITGLIDVVYNNSATTTIILDNSTTGMTGHQDHPATGKTIKGEETYAVDLEKLCKAVGVKRVFTVDPLDVDAVRIIIKQELEADEPSVIITRKPCILITTKPSTRYTIDPEMCKECGLCLNLGCPSLSKLDDVFAIDRAMCAGCGSCYRVCKTGAISVRSQPEVNV
jgi:indolepyruvate ferredoxin oxidoreductase alpha subunit